MEGNLLDRGIGWYLTYEEAIQEATEAPEYGPWWGNPNPGHAIGFGLGVAYVAWPLDFIPDFIPVIGYLDDAAILNLSIMMGGWLWNLMD